MNQKLKLAYLAIIVAAFATLFLTELGPDWAFFDGYGANLFTELLGILATLLLVERILRWQRQEELRPIRVVAARRLRRPVADLLCLLTKMYKAAAPTGGKRHESYPALLDAWAHEAPHLDFMRPAPVFSPMDWSQYVSRTLAVIEDHVNDVLSRYPEVLGTAVVVSAEKVIDHHIWALMRQIDKGAQAQKTATPPVGMFLALHSGGDNADLFEFAKLVRALLDSHNELEDDPVAVLLDDWRPDVAPAFGSARWEGDLSTIEDRRCYLMRGPAEARPRLVPQDHASS